VAADLDLQPPLLQQVADLVERRVYPLNVASLVSKLTLTARMMPVSETGCPPADSISQPRASTRTPRGVFAHWSMPSGTP
jgi:hypothetical protein